jgi:hypothetical protein
MPRIRIVDVLKTGIPVAELGKVILKKYNSPETMAGITIPSIKPSQKESFFKNLNIKFPFFNDRY